MFPRCGVLSRNEMVSSFVTKTANVILGKHRAAGTKMPQALVIGAHPAWELAGCYSHPHRDWWEAELFRLKGVLLLQQSKPDAKQAEANLLKALDVARRQNTNLLELRAAISLYRFGEQQGKHNNTHQLLVEIYNRFTEGFDTPDLKEAKDLIEQS